MGHAEDIPKPTKGQADIWIFPYQYLMMRAYVRGMLSRGKTDFPVAEA
jgi:hypothetical protein